MIDFPKSSGPRSTQQALTEWVFKYFQVDLPGSAKENGNAFDKLMTSKGSSIRIARDKMPLYLQHQGHSRTIVGVEVTKSQDLNLLLFDPGRCVYPSRCVEVIVDGDLRTGKYRKNCAMQLWRRGQPRRQRRAMAAVTSS